MSSVLRRSMSWGRQRFQYEVTIEARRDLKITVHPDLRVAVRAPEGRSIGEVELLVGAKRSWIAKQLREFAQLHPQPVVRRYVSGETHLYLGRQYVLRVEGGPPSVRVAAGRIVVTVHRPESTSAVRRTLDAWYLERARRIFGRQIDELLNQTVRLSNRPIRLRVRKMARRWGSCSPAGTITLNPNLVQAPAACVQYVVAHELCHLLVHDHSSRFFLQLERMVPDWENKKTRLNRFSVAH